ncbi:MAG: hypothetical protein JEZ06_22635 [Anaerolineaceae bacterium]|nr:hypothetical protein [Anaerolineaceae bacterium]
MKKNLIILIALVLTSCSLPGSVQPTSIPSDTPFPPTETDIPPTATQTALPTETPIPSPTITPTPLPEVINASTVGRIGLQGQIEIADLRKVVFSPDGNVLAASSGNQDNFAVQIINVQNQSVQQVLGPFGGIVWSIAFSPDGSLLASVSKDDGGHTLRIWQVSDGALLHIPESPAIAASVTFSPDGQKLAVGGMDREYPEGSVWLYNTNTWEYETHFDAYGGNILDLNFSADGSILAGSSTDGWIRLWRTSDWQIIRTMKEGRQASSVSFTSNAGLLASTFCSTTGNYGCEKGGVMVWRVSDGAPIYQFDDIAESVAFSPDGSLLACGSGTQDPVIRVRYVADWSLNAVLPGAGQTLAFNPEGTLLVTGDFSTISFWGIQ